MNRIKLIAFFLFALIIAFALFRGIFLGHPADMRVEASGL